MGPVWFFPWRVRAFNLGSSPWQLHLMHVFARPNAESNQVGGVVIRSNEKLVMKSVEAHFPLLTLGEDNIIITNSNILWLKLLKVNSDSGRASLLGNVDV